LSVVGYTPQIYKKKDELNKNLDKKVSLPSFGGEAPQQNKEPLQQNKEAPQQFLEAWKAKVIADYVQQQRQ
jgi:hypothetical protein